MERRELSPVDALKRLAGLCAKSEQCESDLRRKLSLWGLTDREQEAVLKYLRDRKFYDDARFAASYVRSKNGVAGWGRRKIQVALMQKRIAAPLIEQAFGELDGEAYLAGLLKVARAKSRGLDLTQYRDKSRLILYLRSRGYLGSEIDQILKSL